jgi:hypothetical protein
MVWIHLTFVRDTIINGQFPDEGCEGGFWWLQSDGSWSPNHEKARLFPFNKALRLSTKWTKQSFIATQGTDKDASIYGTVTGCKKKNK